MAAESGYVVDSAALVAPVTALEFVGEEYLLTGELLHIYHGNMPQFILT